MKKDVTSSSKQQGISVLLKKNIKVFLVKAVLSQKAADQFFFWLPMEVVSKSIICYERWDYEALECIRKLNVEPKEVKHQLMAIQLEPNKEERVMVRYWTKKGDVQGRLYGNLVSNDEEEWPGMYIPLGISLQGMPRWLRHFVAHKYYRDFDICNCAPNLMAQILTRYSLCPASLTHYNANRSAIFDRYSRQYNIPRSEVKTVFIGILHTGKGDPRFRESMVIKAQLDNALKQLMKRPEYAMLYKACLKRGNQLGSFAFAVWSRQEHIVLMCMREYFISLGYHREHMVLCYDGLMIEKDEALDKQGLLDLVALSLHIKEVTGYVLQLEEKSLVPTEEDSSLLASFS